MAPPAPPSLPRPRTCRHAPHVPRAPRPGGDRDRVVTEPSSWPHPSSRASRHWGAGSASGCPVGPATQEAAGEAGSDPPRGRPWPSPREPPSPAGSCKGPGVGAAGRETKVSPLPRAKAAPALQTHGLEAPACTTGAATRSASQLGGRPEARPLGLARGLGHMGSTRPDPRGRGTLPGQACGDQEPHSLGRRGRVPGSTASSRPSRPPACPHGKAAATSRTAPGPGARPHPGPPARPGPTRSASHCTSHGRWPSPPRSGHPRGCPGAAAPGSRAPPGPAGDGAQGQGPGDLQGRPSSLTVPFPLAPVTV